MTLTDAKAEHHVLAQLREHGPLDAIQIVHRAHLDFATCLWPVLCAIKRLKESRRISPAPPSTSTWCGGQRSWKRYKLGPRTVKGGPR